MQTRLQSLVTEPTAKRGLSSVLMTMIREEGAMRPLRGLGAMVVGAGPAHALYFSAYERLKVSFNPSGSSANHNYWAQGAAGSVATLLHDVVMTPAEGMLVVYVPVVHSFNITFILMQCFAC